MLFCDIKKKYLWSQQGITMKISTEIQTFIVDTLNSIPRNPSNAELILRTTAIRTFLTESQKVTLTLAYLGLLGIVVGGAPGCIRWCAKNLTPHNALVVQCSAVAMIAGLMLSLFPKGSGRLLDTSRINLPPVQGTSIVWEDFVEKVHDQGFLVERVCSNSLNDGILKGGYSIDISIGGYKVLHTWLKRDGYNICMHLSSRDFKSRYYI